MKLNNKIKRLAIFLFYDKDGIVDSYIPYMLNDIKKNVDFIYFISNGKVKEDSKKKIDGIVDVICERKNVGFDVWGYKEALQNIGWKNLYEYDEVVLMNYTIMGPIYPFKIMFDEMSMKDLDFWGMTQFHKVDYDPFKIIDVGFIPDHLQSHFIVVRNKMLKSKEFKKYWEDMPMITSYDESIAFHETKFTRFFEELGYKWAPYVDTSDMKDLNSNLILYYPKRLIEEKKCPIFKRRSFMHDYDDVLNNTMGESTLELYNYLKDKTDYDVNMIWDNLLRCYDMELIKNNMQLNYVLPENVLINKRHDKKIALVFHAYFPDLIEETRKCINSMPAYSDIYITTNTEEKKKIFEEEFKKNRFNKLEVRLIENRGRDVSALLIGAKDVVMNYDYVCFAHDKKVSQISTGSIGKSFAYNCFENLFPTEEFVENVIETFENNPKLGLLTPMPPHHADYYGGVGHEWTMNYELTASLAHTLGLNVPINKKYAPIAPLGTMFWFRPEGMKKLFDHDWRYEEFPQEPNKIDGTILHAIERVYGYVEQDAGYYSAWLFSEKGSAITITNFFYMLSNINKELSNYDICGTYYTVHEGLKNKINVVKNLKNAYKYYDKAYPELFDNNSRDIMKIYLDYGNGFNEDDTTVGTYTISNNVLLTDFKLPFKDREIKAIRIDPGEKGFFALKDVKITLSGEKKEIIGEKDLYMNALKSNKEYLFLTNDPNIIYSLKESQKIKTITLESKIDYDISAKLNTFIVDKDKTSFFRRIIRKLRRIWK